MGNDQNTIRKCLRQELDDVEANLVAGGLPIGGGGGIESAQGKVYYCGICKTNIALINGITVESHQATHGK